MVTEFAHGATLKVNKFCFRPVHNSQFFYSRREGVESDPHQKMIPIVKSENDPHIYFGNNFEENDPHTKKGK